MTSAQIQTLLQGPHINDSIVHATKALNDSFSSLQQVIAGTALADAINEARTVSESYNSQLAASQVNIDRLIRETHGKAKEQLVSAQELSLLRHSLTDELTGLSEELESAKAPDGSELSLLEEIETLHRNLKELQSVKGYVQVIHRALQLSEQTIKKFEQAPVTAPVSDASLADYVLLQQLVDSVGKACKEAENGTGQDVKLCFFLADLQDKTWLRVKDALSSVLLSAAEELHWPMPVDYAAAKLESRKAFESAFSNLLRLQDIGEKLHLGQEAIKSSKDGIYPLQALIRPLAQRFKYHFEGTRQTNRLDKPEWYFAHILNVSHEHRPFLEKVIQRLLRASKYTSVNAWREFTRLLLPIISRKIKCSMPALLPHPPLLAHTVYQALAFDDALREAGFSLAGTLDKSREDLSDWEGTSDVILGSKEWFDAWLEGERKFAHDQYNDIIMSSDAWQLSNDSEDDALSDREVHPTNSARRVKALIEQVTDRYKALPRFLHMTRFLVSVQVPILELYHTRISESLDAFEALSSFLVRAVPGALAEQTGRGWDGKTMTAGVEDAQRLLKAYVSAKWMASVMSAWGEEMFFLELWHQICKRASLRSRVQDVDALPDSKKNVGDEGTIFEELVAQYNKLAERAEGLLIRQISGEVEADLKAHLLKQPETTADGEDADPSQTLLGPIARLSKHVSVLTKSLPAPSAIGLYRRIAGHIASHILQRQVLYRGRSWMSARAGRVVLEEANLWVKTSRMAMSASGLRRVEGPWERLLEAGRLLSLEGDSFHNIVQAARLGDEKQYEQLAGAIGITELSTEEVLAVLSVREDFPR